MVDEFISWCDLSFLKAVLKTKEMIIHLQKQSLCPPASEVNGDVIKLVDHYKYLGIALDNAFFFEPQGKGPNNDCTSQETEFSLKSFTGVPAVKTERQIQIFLYA